ncbi:hypothetical protein EXN66_Car013083 [Channa argus]|uniref:Uncharacterized protein n=1 Tax=Channa argus TaxID=215402 RepID=A0A6G1Q4X1_CHAAH|nr:hypothetical protein EXN66_Car013083 [Channa argus]
MKVHHIFICSFFLTQPTASQCSSTSSENSTTSPSPNEAQEPQRDPFSERVVVVYASMILVVTCIGLSVAAARKLIGCSVERSYNNRKVNRVYENKQNGSHPVEVSTVYPCANYTKPNEVESTDEYGLDTAPANCYQYQATV